MIPKVLKDYQSSSRNVTVISVSEEVEKLAQKISYFAPRYFPTDGLNTYQIAISQLDKGRNRVPFIQLIKTICEDICLQILVVSED